MYQLCPSILSADFNRLGEQIQTLEKQGVKWTEILYRVFLLECR